MATMRELLERAGLADAERPSFDALWERSKAQADRNRPIRGGGPRPSFDDMWERSQASVPPDPEPIPAAPRQDRVRRMTFETAPKVDVRGLGGDEVAPAPEEEALANMAALKSRRPLPAARRNSSGVDLPPEEMPPPRRLSETFPDFPAISRVSEESAQAAREESSRPRPQPGTIKFDGPARDQGSPDEFTSPQFERKVPVDVTYDEEPGKTGVVQVNRWTPKGFGLDLESAQQNKYVTDPEFRDGYGNLEPDPSDTPWERAKGEFSGLLDELMRSDMKPDFTGKDGEQPATDEAPTEAPSPAQAPAPPARPAAPPRPVAQRPAARPQLATGSRGLSPSPARPSFGEDASPTAAAGPASPRQPLMAAQGMLSGATPDTSADEAEMLDAQRARDEQLFAAQVASQFGHYADIQGGTETGDRGAILRESANNPVNDLKAKRALREGALSRQQAAQDKAFDREGVVTDRATKAEGAQRTRDLNDPMSPKSKQARAMAVSLYPDKVKRIPPGEWAQMSAADIQTFFGEAQPDRPVAGRGGGSGGGGLTPAQMAALRKGLPKEVVNAYRTMQDAKTVIDGMGGWDALNVGGLGAFTPRVMLDKQNQAARSKLARVASAFLSSRAGTAISKGEKEIILGMINADTEKFATDGALLKQGMEIIEQALADNIDQGMAGAPSDARGAILGDVNIDDQWVRGQQPMPQGPGHKNATLPEPTAAPPATKPRRMRLPSGEEVEVY